MINRNYILPVAAAVMFALLILLPYRARVLNISGLYLETIIIAGLLAFSSFKNSISVISLSVSLLSIAYLIHFNIKVTSERPEFFSYVGLIIILTLVLKSKLEINKKILNFSAILFLIICLLSSFLSNFFISLAGWQSDTFGLDSGFIKRARSTLGGPVITAEFCSLFFAYFYSSYKHSRNKSYLYISIMALFCTVLTFSRINILACTVFIAVLYIKDNPIFNFRKIIVSLFAFVMLTPIVMIINSTNYFSQNGVFERLNPQYIANNEGDINRIKTIENTVNEIKTSIFFGKGPGSIFSHRFDSSTTSENYIYINNALFLIEPHNAYLLAIQEIGMLGLFMILILWVGQVNLKNAYSLAFMLMIMTSMVFSSDIIAVPAYTLCFTIILNIVSRYNSVDISEEISYHKGGRK